MRMTVRVPLALATRISSTEWASVAGNECYALPSVAEWPELVLTVVGYLFQPLPFSWLGRGDS